MAFHFTCPHCGETNDVADDLTGQVVSCAHCGKEANLPPATTCDVRCSCGGAMKMLAIVLVVGVLGMSMVMMRRLPVTEPARRMPCVNNLKQIALAMHKYAIEYKCFPPAYIPDKNGKPMHSWRVLILPYLEDQNLYSQYRFDEPWNSPNNKRVADTAMRVFQCPTRPHDPNSFTTDYMMVVGPHTISDGPHGRKFSEITDGTSNTIMLVEVADSGTPWAEPKDLLFDRMTFKIDGNRQQGISSDHSGGVNAALCDGSVRFLSDTINPQLVKAMLTIDGGEQVPAEP
jgi:prepilin-type processing-associated H-X9-DG protein